MWGSHARSGAQGRVNRVPREKPAARAAPENCPNLRENGRKTPRPLGSLRGSIHLSWADAIHEVHIFSNFLKNRVVCFEIEVSLQGFWPVNPKVLFLLACCLYQKKHAPVKMFWWPVRPRPCVHAKIQLSFFCGWLKKDGKKGEYWRTNDTTAPAVT